MAVWKHCTGTEVSQARYKYYKSGLMAIYWDTSLNYKGEVYIVPCLPAIKVPTYTHESEYVVNIICANVHDVACVVCADTVLIWTSTKIFSMLVLSIKFSRF